MKNSASTNLLMLDEVFDGSLDINGTDFVMTILNTLGEDSNIFIISHKDALFDKFRSVIKFEKKNGYSQIAK
jgi:DNA repair exonuclease SbcCD ATPase subunit